MCYICYLPRDILTDSFYVCYSLLKVCVVDGGVLEGVGKGGGGGGCPVAY